MHLHRSTADPAWPRVSASESAQQQVPLESRHSQKQPFVGPQDPPSRSQDLPILECCWGCQLPKEDSRGPNTTAAAKECPMPQGGKTGDVYGHNGNQAPLFSESCGLFSKPGRTRFLMELCRDLGRHCSWWERKQAPRKALKWKPAGGSP